MRPGKVSCQLLISLERQPERKAAAQGEGERREGEGKRGKEGGKEGWEGRKGGEERKGEGGGKEGVTKPPT